MQPQAQVAQAQRARTHLEELRQQALEAVRHVLQQTERGLRQTEQGQVLAQVILQAVALLQAGRNQAAGQAQLLRSLVQNQARLNRPQNRAGHQLKRENQD